MRAIDKAKRLQVQEGYSCVITDGVTVFASRESGIRPLLSLYLKNGEGKALWKCAADRPLAAADAIVGKAAALLYVGLGVQEVYAGVLSESGKKVLEAHGIAVSYKTLTEKIIDRGGDGLCPMEQTVLGIDEPEEAFCALSETVRRLKQEKAKKAKKAGAGGVFPEVKFRFGFGMMRLPMNGDEVDHEETCRMVDAFLKAGFNYFDTAHGYLSGKSEIALREALVKRHPRSSFLVADKLSGPYFSSEAEIRPLFDKQLEACGVSYFDFYLMHAQNAQAFEKFKKCRAYETAFALKAEGKVRHVGLSFHDRAAVLDRILTEYPQIEFVQIQLNYLDYEDASVEGRKVYEVCVKHGKPAVVMEPVKGGSLVNLPPEAQQVIDALGQKNSNASYAIRFAAGFPNVFMVLSGMSNLAQMEDNISCMKDFRPLSGTEQKAVADVCRVYRTLGMVSCTGCKYCVLDNDCPKKIPIPALFACFNKKNLFRSWNEDHYYRMATRGTGKASDCIGCGKCEKICPQHLPIRTLLAAVAKEFDR